MVDKAKEVLEVIYVYNDTLYDTLQLTSIQYDDYDKSSTALATQSLEQIIAEKESVRG